MMLKLVAILLTVVLVPLVESKVDDVLGTWRLIPSLTTGMTEQFHQETGFEVPPDMEAARQLVIIATIWRADDKHIVLRQTLENGFRFGKQEDDMIPLEKPKLCDLGGKQFYITMEEIDRGINIYAHPRGTKIYFEEAYQKNDKGQLIRTTTTWKSGLNCVHVFERDESKQEL